MRRFLNYLLLVAAPAGEATPESIEGLRERFGDFDKQLVDLATQGGEGQEKEVRQFYEKQCEVLGLDPKTFQPAE